MVARLSVSSRSYEGEVGTLRSLLRYSVVSSVLGPYPVMKVKKCWLKSKGLVNHHIPKNGGCLRARPQSLRQFALSLYAGQRTRRIRTM